MKISKVEALAISIPLRAALSDAVRRITHRDHLIVRITTGDGLCGEGFTLGYDGSLLNGLQTMPTWQECESSI